MKRNPPLIKRIEALPPGDMRQQLVRSHNLLTSITRQVDNLITGFGSFEIGETLQRQTVEDAQQLAALSEWIAARYR